MVDKYIIYSKEELLKKNSFSQQIYFFDLVISDEEKVCEDVEP